MGFLSELGALAGGGQTAQVAGGLMQALEQHPGGVAGLLDAVKGNGLGQNVDAWATGKETQATAEQVQQGVGNTGLIEKTAAKTGLPPAVVTMALTTLLPMVVRHFAPGGNAAPQSEFGGLAQQLLGKIF